MPRIRSMFAGFHSLALLSLLHSCTTPVHTRAPLGRARHERLGAAMIRSCVVLVLALEALGLPDGHGVSGGHAVEEHLHQHMHRLTEITRAVTDGPLAGAAGVSARSRPPSSCDTLILSRPGVRGGIHLIILTPTVSLVTLPLIWHETRRQWQAARARQQLGMLTRATWIVAAGMTRREWVANPLAPAAEQAISKGQTRSLQARFCLHKSHPRSLVGADERNSVLDQLPLSNSTWLYFLDADNLLHPNFFVGIGSALTASPTARMVFFTQIRKARDTEDEIVVSRRPSGPAQVRIGQVDTGTQVIRRDLLGGVRFAMGHKDCDGMLVERLHISLLATGLGEGGIPHGELFLAEELALYNWLKCVDPQTPLRYDGVVRAGRDSVRMLPLVRGGNGFVVSSVGRGLHRECGPPVHIQRRQRPHRLFVSAYKL